MSFPSPKPKSLHPPRKMYLIGAFLVIAQTVFSTLCGTCMKYLSNDFPVFVASFYEYAIATFIALPILLGRGLSLKKTKKFPLFFVRSIAGFSITLLVYVSMKCTTLVNVMALNNTAPLFIPIVIFFSFKQPLRWSLLAPLLIGYIGILCILKPTGANFLNFGCFLALLSGIISAITVVAVRRLTMSETHEEIIFYYLFISMILSLIGSFITNTWVMPNKMQIIALGGMGVFLVLGQLCLVKGLSYAPASRLAPFLYFAIIASGFLGWILFQEKPSWASLIGIAFIIIGAILSIFVGDPPYVPTKERKDV